MTKDNQGEALSLEERVELLADLRSDAERGAKSVVLPIGSAIFLLAALEEAEGREKNHGFARFVDAEEIAELMEAGARTWMPIALAKPKKSGSEIVMTTDDVPVIGQAFWHQHGDGTWALHWSSVSPKEDCWNDPISETNKGIACFMPMPEGPCEARANAMVSASATIEALTARAEKAEQQRDQKHEALTEAVERLEETLRWSGGWECTEEDLLGNIRRALSPSKSEADNHG